MDLFLRLFVAPASRDRRYVMDADRFPLNIRSAANFSITDLRDKSQTGENDLKKGFICSDIHRWALSQSCEEKGRTENGSVGYSCADLSFPLLHVFPLRCAQPRFATDFTSEAYFRPPRSGSPTSPAAYFRPRHRHCFAPVIPTCPARLNMAV
jgi:hypothetical protein